MVLLCPTCPTHLLLVEPHSSENLIPMPAQPTAPYPGFDETGKYETPRQAPRVRPEAEEVARKHKGSINLFAQDDRDTGPAQPPPPVPRCGTYDAQQNYILGRTGSIGGLMGGSATPRPDPGACPNARVKPEASNIADHHKGKSTAALFNSYGNLPGSARPGPRVRNEAQVSASMDMGGRMSNLLHNPKELPETPKPVPRVKADASENAQLGSGSQMNKVMCKYGTTPRSMRGVPRVKPEAKNNADLDEGKRMGKIFNEYGKQPNSSRPAPRVTSSGQNMANLDRGNRISRMIHDGDNYPKAPVAPPRAVTSDARRIVKKNRGQMSQLFSESSKWQMVPKVGR